MQLPWTNLQLLLMRSQHGNEHKEDGVYAFYHLLNDLTPGQCILTVEDMKDPEKVLKALKHVYLQGHRDRINIIQRAYKVVEPTEVKEDLD